MLLITMILLFGFTASACNLTKKVTEPVEIHIQVPYQESSDSTVVAFVKPYIDAAANFHKLNPSITVIIDYNTKSNYSSEDSLRLLESSAPQDIVPINPSQNFAYEKKALLQDLLMLQ